MFWNLIDVELLRQGLYYTCYLSTCEIINVPYSPEITLLNRSLFSQSYKFMLWKTLFSFFLWLICENYLPLSPSQNDWPPGPKGPPLGGTPISTTVHKTKSTFSHRDFNSFHIYGGKWDIMKHGIG